MKENKYDNPFFFEQYSKMPRSVDGLEGAGEWYQFRKLFPDLSEKRVLDLGCGFGWHCAYAAEQGAAYVLGTDLSEKMLEQAGRQNAHPAIEYRRVAVEDLAVEAGSFDVVVSSLAFHYVADFGAVCDMVHKALSPGGHFVFSVEHPIFTAQGAQDWHYDQTGKALHWPVDNYYREGWREAVFLGADIKKYHKTLTTYVDSLLTRGFRLNRLVEPEPDPRLLERHPEYQDELRRPMFLLVSAQK